MVDKMQTSRYEFKYLIDEVAARRARQFISSYLLPDHYTVGKEGSGYMVHSLYMDSADLLTCRATQCGEKNRFKLRVRFYDDNPDSPVFFEIKRRENQVIKKSRAVVKRSSVDRLINGGFPQPTDLFKPSEKDLAALLDFFELRDMIGARPAAYTSYLREGYEPADANNVRVTFDREIRSGKYIGRLSNENHEKWPLVGVEGVVLELKFNDRFPMWMHELVEWFDLNRTSVPKYVECISLIQHQSPDIPLNVDSASYLF